MALSVRDFRSFEALSLFSVSHIACNVYLSVVVCLLTVIFGFADLVLFGVWMILFAFFGVSGPQRCHRVYISVLWLFMSNIGLYDCIGAFLISVREVMFHV